MDWLRSLGERGGPFIAVSQSFLSHHRGAPRDPARGAAGLRALAAAIDAWAEREDASETEDERFVEGAGALLGALLCDALGGRHVARGGAHRVALGEDGFFDPFAAVSHALDADDSRSSLAILVARAEAEALSADGFGRARRLVRELLRQERPELAVEGGFEASLELSGGIELDLGRLVEATLGESEEAARKAARKLVSMLPGAAEDSDSDWEERLQPRVVSPRFAAEHPALLARPLAGGALSVALLLVHGDRARYVRASEPSRWGTSARGALEIAIRNLAIRSERARLLRVDTSAGPLICARTGDGLDAARALLPALHEVLAPELGDALWIAVPHRDALWACGEGRALREALRARARDDARRAPHAISESLFALTPGGLAPEAPSQPP